MNYFLLFKTGRLKPFVSTANTCSFCNMKSAFLHPVWYYFTQSLRLLLPFSSLLAFDIFPCPLDFCTSSWAFSSPLSLFWLLSSTLVIFFFLSQFYVDRWLRIPSDQVLISNINNNDSNKYPWIDSYLKTLNSGNWTCEKGEFIQWLMS